LLVFHKNSEGSEKFSSLFKNKERDVLLQRANEIEPLKVQLNSLKLNANSLKESLMKISDLNEKLNVYAADFRLPSQITTNS
jgi:hypothetical protein